MRFVERREFGGDPREVWRRLSNLDAIPVYWHGTREFRATKSDGGVIADIVFAFGGKGKARVISEDDRMILTLDYFEGPFKGTQKVAVKENFVEAEWNVTFRGAYRVLGPLNASHFRSGTRHALMRLCEGQAS